MNGPNFKFQLRRRWQYAIGTLKTLDVADFLGNLMGAVRVGVNGGRAITFCASFIHMCMYTCWWRQYCLDTVTVEMPVRTLKACKFTLELTAGMQDVNSQEFKDMAAIILHGVSETGSHYGNSSRWLGTRNSSVQMYLCIFLTPRLDCCHTQTKMPAFNPFERDGNARVAPLNAGRISKDNLIPSHIIYETSKTWVLDCA